MKHIAEFEISLQPIQESSWLARVLSFKSARKSDHYKWLEEVNYFNQVITYIFHANYTERDFSSDIKTIIEPLLRQYSVDSATIKTILEGKQSLSDIKKKLFSILDPYYASKTFHPIFERLSELHKVIVSHKERDKFSEDEVSLVEEDDAIAQYKQIYNASLVSLNQTLKHHDNQNLLDISRVLLSQLSKSLERAEAIAYSRRLFWFLRWLFPKREAQYQQRMKQIKARRDSLEELIEAFVMVKYERLNHHLVDKSLSKQQFEDFKKDIEDYIQKDIDPHITSFIQGRESSLNEIGFIELAKSIAKTSNPQPSEEDNEKTVLFQGYQKLLHRTDLLSQEIQRKGLELYKRVHGINPTLRTIITIYEQYNIDIQDDSYIKDALEQKFGQDTIEKAYEIIREANFLGHQYYAKEAVEETPHLAKEAYQLGIKRLIEKTGNDKLKTKFDLKYKFKSRVNKRNLLNTLGKRLFMHGVSENHVQRIQQYIDTLSTLTDSDEVNLGLRILRKIADNTLDWEDLGEREGNLGYKHINALNNIFPREVYEQFIDQLKFEDAEFHLYIIHHYIARVFKISILPTLSHQNKSEYDEKLSRLQLYYHLLETYKFDKFIKTHQRPAVDAERYFFRLLSRPIGSELAISPINDSETISTHFLNIHISINDIRALRRALGNYIRAYTGENNTYTYLMLQIGKAYQDHELNTIDPMFEYFSKRIDYIFKDTHFDQLNNDDLLWLQELVLGKQHERVSNYFNEVLSNYLTSPGFSWNHVTQVFVDTYGDQANQEECRLKGLKHHLERRNIKTSKDFILYLDRTYKKKGGLDGSCFVSRERVPKLQAIAAHYMPSSHEGYTKQVYSTNKAYSLLDYNSQILYDNYIGSHREMYRIERLENLIEQDNSDLINQFIHYFTDEKQHYDGQALSSGNFAVNDACRVHLDRIFSQAIFKMTKWSYNLQKLAIHFGFNSHNRKIFIKGLEDALQSDDIKKVSEWVSKILSLGINSDTIEMKGWQQSVAETFLNHLKAHPCNIITFELIRTFGRKQDLQNFRTYRIRDILEGRVDNWWDLSYEGFDKENIDCEEYEEYEEVSNKTIKDFEEYFGKTNTLTVGQQLPPFIEFFKDYLTLSETGYKQLSPLGRRNAERLCDLFCHERIITPELSNLFTAKREREKNISECYDQEEVDALVGQFHQQLSHSNFNGAFESYHNFQHIYRNALNSKKVREENIYHDVLIQSESLLLKLLSDCVENSIRLVIFPRVSDKSIRNYLLGRHHNKIARKYKNLAHRKAGEQLQQLVKDEHQKQQAVFLENHYRAKALEHIHGAIEQELGYTRKTEALIQETALEIANKSESCSSFDDALTIIQGNVRTKLTNEEDEYEASLIKSHTLAINKLSIDAIIDSFITDEIIHKASRLADIMPSKLDRNLALVIIREHKKQTLSSEENNHHVIALECETELNEHIEIEIRQQLGINNHKTQKHWLFDKLSTEAFDESKASLQEEVETTVEAALESTDPQKLTREVIATQISEFNRSIYGIIHTFRLYKDYQFLTPELHGLFQNAIPLLLKHTKNRGQAITGLGKPSSKPDTTPSELIEVNSDNNLASTL